MSAEVRLVSPDMSVMAVAETTRAQDLPVFLIGTPGRLVGIVTPGQIAAAIEAGAAADPIAALVAPEAVHAHPDHPSEIVLERLALSGGCLPVVSRGDAQQIVGVVTLDHVMQFIRRRPSVGMGIDVKPQRRLFT